MRFNILRRSFEIAAVAAPLLLLFQPLRVLADDDGARAAGVVYVMSNATANTVLVFQRNANGSVAKVQEVSTQGQGAGTGSDSLGSQGALTLSGDGRLLLAVNAGSGEISSLSVTRSGGLKFVGKAASGGTMPVSVALRGDTAYVLNAAGTPNVTAFRVDPRGNLTAIAGSTLALPGGANAAPAQVGITPDGEVLVVTEKNTNMIDLFPIDDHGNMGSPSSVPSDGATPFGFTFGRGRTLVVSEAANSTFSSYEIHNENNNPTLVTITNSLPDGGSAACWIVRDGALLFTTNSASNTISTLTVSGHGGLQLSAATAATTPSGTTPIDMALTGNGRFLYTTGTGNGSLTGFRVQDGKLSPVASVMGLPLSIQGIVAR